GVEGGLGAQRAGEPGLDVAADVDDLQVGPGGLELRGAARRAGPDATVARQRVERASVARAQGVPRVLALRGDVRQAGRGRGRQVLERVDGDVAPPGAERVAQRGDEHTGAAEGGE